MQTALFKDEVFRRFANELPIATAVQVVLRTLLEPMMVDEIFRENADKQYEPSLLFSALTQLMSSVVLGKHASVSAGYKKFANRLGVALNSVYEKPQRVEPETSRKLVRASYHQVVQARCDQGGVAQHEVPGYTTRILDGNHLSKTEHRLAETRDVQAAPLPGKSLVVFDPRFDAVADVSAIAGVGSRDRVLAHDGGAELRDYRAVLSEGGVVLFCQCVDRLQRVVDRQGNDRRRAWSRSERDDVSLLHGPRDSRNDRRPVSGVTSGAVGRDLDDFGVRVRCQAAPDLSRDRSANISHINPRPKKPPPKRKGNKQTVHVSTKRILDKRK